MIRREILQRDDEREKEQSTERDVDSRPDVRDEQERAPDARDYRRRERRVDLEDETAREALRSGDELWPRYRDNGPDDTAERRELAAKLERAFKGLPEIHQAVIVLRELEGFSYEEIAETLGIKKGTVMSRLFHARRGMQTNLADAPVQETSASTRLR